MAKSSGKYTHFIMCESRLMLLHKHHGKTLANTIFNSVKSEYMQSKSVYRHSRAPCLKIYLLDDNPASVTFIRQKMKLGENLDFDMRFQHLRGYTNESVSNLICADNSDDSIDGITIQLPVNGQKSIPPIDLIAPDKDIDGIGRVGRSLLVEGSGKWPYFVSPAAVGILSILKSLTYVLDKRIVIIGDGVTVGWPLSNYLRRLGAERVVSLFETQSREEQSGVCAEADVIVIGSGVPYHVDETFLSRTKQQIIVDCGCHVDLEGKIRALPCIRLSEKARRDGNITHILVPNINGIGPLTVVSLFKNLLKAYNIHRKK